MTATTLLETTPSKMIPVNLPSRTGVTETQSSYQLPR